MLEEPKVPHTEPPQTAFRDAMGSAHSSYLGRNRSRRKSNNRKVQPQGVGPGLRAVLSLTCPPSSSEGGSTSNVSMVNNGLIQHDSDIVVEEEREEDMETGASACPTTPVPPKESPIQQGSEARDTVQDDQLSQMSEESTDKNPPHNSDLNEEKLLGLLTDISVPRGHLDDSIALIVPLEEDNL